MIGTQKVWLTVLSSSILRPVPISTTYRKPFQNYLWNTNTYWGAFLTGASVSMKFVDGIHESFSIRFGWIVNQQLASAERTASTYKAMELFAGNGGKVSAAWAGIRNLGFGHASGG